MLEEFLQIESQVGAGSYPDILMFVATKVSVGFSSCGCETIVSWVSLASGSPTEDSGADERLFEASAGDFREARVFPASNLAPEGLEREA